jgi:hypothetical protein
MAYRGLRSLVALFGWKTDVQMFERSRLRPPRGPPGDRYSLEQLDIVIEAGSTCWSWRTTSPTNTLHGLAGQNREFIKPYNMELVERAHARGFRAVTHSDGSLWPLLDIILETG